VNSEPEKHKFAILFVSPVNYPEKKEVEKAKLCTLIQKELSDPKDLYLFQKDLDLILKKSSRI
jgi:hypothetical protein